MPEKVGETLQFNMYESWAKSVESKECRIGDRKFPTTVTRCSNADADYVYRFDSEMSGGLDTVCGMD